jgi:hypothetical protein
LEGFQFGTLDSFHLMTSKGSASGIEGRDTRIDVPLQGCQDATKERKKQA